MKKEYIKAISTIDPVIFTIEDQELKVLLIKRDKEPFEGKYSLPGGYIYSDQSSKIDTNIEESLKRILLKKTGVSLPYFEQLHTFGSIDRDPRGWSISISYLSLISSNNIIKNDNNFWVNVNDIEKYDIGFDHLEIINFALNRIRNKVNYSILPVYLLPKRFTQTNLQNIYEIVLGVKLDKSAFRKKINNLDFLEDTGEKDLNVSFRPPKLYKLKDEHLKYFRSNINK